MNTLILFGELDYPIGQVANLSLTSASLSSPFGLTISTSPTLAPPGAPLFVVYTGNHQAVYLQLDPITFSVQASASAPEPATLSLLAVGFAGLAAIRRRPTLSTKNSNMSSR